MSTTPPLWRWRLFVIWLALGGLAGAIGCLIPLFETLGYEYALLTSLISSLGAGHLAASYPHRVRVQLARFPGARHSALVMYRRTLSITFLLLAPPIVLSLLNGLRVPQCNLLEGFQFYLAMPVCSVIVATVVGLFAGLVTPGARSASVLWFIFFAFGLFAGVRCFHSTPAVFVFGPFFGYFPGVLYDELIHVETRLITYRVASLTQAAALLALLSWLLDPTSLRLSLKRLTQRPKTGLSTSALGLIAAALYLAGPTLGHRTDRAQLEELLPHKVSKGKLDLFFPLSADLFLVEELVDDAVFSLHQVEQYLEFTAEQRIAVFFFANNAQKSNAMGAHGTNVTKPWRSEVYVTLAEPPHGVLRHELTHAVAAPLGRGPFAIAGALGGLWPNPGMIEGLATAAQGPRTDLTVHQWAAAMKQLKLLKPLGSIFGLRFFNVNASAAYTAAGSFCSWIRDSYGAGALKAAYQTSNFENATHKEMSSLEKQWHEFLSRVPLSRADIAVARHRFDRPAVIHSVCVHEVARLRVQASRFASMKLWSKALNSYNEAHERSGRSTSTRLALFFALVDSGKTVEVRNRAGELLVAPLISSVSRVTISEILADLDLAAGRRQKAKRNLADLALQARSEADRRRLEVKAHLAGLPTAAATNRLFDVLARRPGPREVAGPLATLSIAEAAYAMPSDPILAYLLARQHYNYRDWKIALTWLHRAEQRGLANTTYSILLAARMMRGRSLFYLDRHSEARSLFKQIANDESAREGARERARDWVDRCASPG